MDRREFMEKIVSELGEYMSSKLDGEYRIEKNEYVKYNDQMVQGIVIRRGTEPIAPSINLEMLYKMYDDGMSFEGVMQQIVRMYESSMGAMPTVKPEHFLGIKDVSYALRLLGKERNSVYLEENVNMEFAPGLYLTADIYISNGKKDEWRSKVPKKLIENEGIDASEFFDEVRMKNADAIPARLVAIEEMIGGGSTQKINLLEEGTLGASKCVYVLTTAKLNYGAAAIAYPGMLERIGECIDDDYYVIPCSVHELLIVPMKSGIGPEALTEMILDTNSSVLAKEEILSDDLFVYKRGTEQLAVWKDAA